MIEKQNNIRQHIRLKANDLYKFMRNLMIAAGANIECAEAAAQIHLEADLRGVNLQGADYLPYTIKNLERGIIDGMAKPSVVKELGATALIDGNRGLGQLAALKAVEIVSAKACKFGNATVSVCNSTDIFMIGAYAERISQMGLIGIVMTSGPPLVHPYGGVEKMLSTNPVAFGMPVEGETPFVFDMATSALSSSRIRQAAYFKESLPPGTGVDYNGNPTTDASLIKAGAIAPLAEHKGFGLALCIAMLCGPLSGSGIGPELAGWQGEGQTKTQGHFFYALDPEYFTSSTEFANRSQWYIETIKKSKKAENIEEIRIPGERAEALRKKQINDGVLILEETWRVLAEQATKYKVDVPPVISTFS